MNNLRALRLAHGWTQERAADAFGTTRNQYVKLEIGARRLSDKWIERAATAYGIDPSEVVRDRDRLLPHLGSIGAGGLVTWAADVDAIKGDLGLLWIIECSLGPLFSGWEAVLQCVSVPGHLLKDGQTYVVGLSDGRSLVRRVTRATTSSRYPRWHLSGWNCLPHFEAEVVAAHQIDGLRQGSFGEAGPPASEAQIGSQRPCRGL